MNFNSRSIRILWSATALSALGLTACQKQDKPQKAIESVATSGNIRFIAAHPLDIPEPSGLSLSKDKESLWTVGDSDGGIYQIDLEGRALGHFQTPHEDIEGVTTIDSEHLAYLEERNRRIIIARKDGQLLREAPIPLLGNDNKGPEALTYDEDAAEFHIVKESPGTLITLNADLEETRRQQLKFAQDYSSISFDSANKHFWVLSDQSKSIHVVDMDLKLITTFSINVDQMEGLAIDHAKRRIYLISDPLAKLFVFEFDAF